MPHLWEIDHSYYCSEFNYYANDTQDRFKSWADFLSEYAAADPDYNLLFRWDWRIEDRHDEAGEVLIGTEHRLYIFWMGQRKGLFHCSIVDVTEADEPVVIEFLRPRWEYMRALWAPLPDVAAAAAIKGDRI